MNRQLPSRTSFLLAGLAMALLALPAMSLTASLASSSLAVAAPDPVAEGIAAPQTRETADAQIDEALSAAPPSFAAAADVYVMRDGEMVRVRAGDGLTACILTRTHPDSSFPICYDESATRSVLPTALERARLYADGLEDADVRAHIAAAMESGELPVPERGAMAWMISPQQVIYSGSRRIGQWYPHVMVYMPNATLAEFGLAEPQRGDTLLVDAGMPGAHLVIKTRSWSNEEAWQEPQR